MGQPNGHKPIIFTWIHRVKKRTGRTETSKYPEEKKSTEIPLVAASERGLAEQELDSGMVWKVQRHRVIAPYTKSTIDVLSRSEHEKLWLKMGGPSSKAKYSLLTDSELVPWGKGEKNPGEGSEIDPETVCVQAVGVPPLNYF